MQSLDDFHLASIARPCEGQRYRYNNLKTSLQPCNDGDETQSQKGDGCCDDFVNQNLKLYGCTTLHGHISNIAFVHVSCALLLCLPLSILSVTYIHYVRNILDSETLKFINRSLGNVSNIVLQPRTTNVSMIPMYHDSWFMSPNFPHHVPFNYSPIVASTAATPTGQTIDKPILCNISLWSPYVVAPVLAGVGAGVFIIAFGKFWLLGVMAFRLGHKLHTLLRQSFLDAPITIDNYPNYVNLFMALSEDVGVIEQTVTFRFGLMILSSATALAMLMYCFMFDWRLTLLTVTFGILMISFCLQVVVVRQKKQALRSLESTVTFSCTDPCDPFKEVDTKQLNVMMNNFKKSQVIKDTLCGLDIGFHFFMFYLAISVALLYKRQQDHTRLQANGEPDFHCITPSGSVGMLTFAVLLGCIAIRVFLSSLRMVNQSGKCFNHIHETCLNMIHGKYEKINSLLEMKDKEKEEMLQLVSTLYSLPFWTKVIWLRKLHLMSYSSYFYILLEILSGLGIGGFFPAFGFILPSAMLEYEDFKKFKVLVMHFLGFGILTLICWVLQRMSFSVMSVRLIQGVINLKNAVVFTRELFTLVDEPSRKQLLEELHAMRNTKKTSLLHVEAIACHVPSVVIAAWINPLTTIPPWAVFCTLYWAVFLIPDLDKPLHQETNKVLRDKLWRVVQDDTVKEVNATAMTTQIDNYYKEKYHRLLRASVAYASILSSAFFLTAFMFYMGVHSVYQLKYEFPTLLRVYFLLLFAIAVLPITASFLPAVGPTQHSLDLSNLPQSVPKRFILVETL